ncbi:MAG TPA: TIGR03617 family F420-dependent LLM class oxidoreductase [Micromonosporaceae bacterium]|jgi:probable F420-dependent oxidoreductase|nr:TIGR03617 family F420-dependent LLM class oxidoreductase [Micromonosporaceae bacterium]
MLLDFMADVSASPLQIDALAGWAEEAGYDGLGVPETGHDAFPSLTLAARATDRITLQSAIAVAFARNPMTVAMLANDLQLISNGRFQLGLGSQVKPHIERRFSMPWSHPAARMEEFLAAVRAIWASWATGERLAFRGAFYHHTLMTDFFNPGRNPHGNPPILLAAVGERMTEVAGRVADGLLVHSFTTPAYLAERTLPALHRARGGVLDGFAVCLAALVVLGADEAERARAEEAVRLQIAFYGSTPSYRPVLDAHGWGALATRLNELSRRAEWAEMGRLIDDDVLSAFAVSGDATTVAAELLARFGAAVTRISLYTPYDVEPALRSAVTDLLRAG